MTSISKPIRNLTTVAIILKKIPYKETSVIVKVFSQILGHISVIIHGVRKEKSRLTGQIEILSEVELVLYKSSNSNLFTAQNIHFIRNYQVNSSYTQIILMQAGVELILQLIISETEASNFYDLLIKYFLYIAKTQKNGIAIFWRFVLRIFVFLGIELNIQHCANCNKPLENLVNFAPLFHGFLCRQCSKKNVGRNISIDSKSGFLIKNLYQIGNILEDVEITSNMIIDINRIILIYLTDHYHQKFHLNCLEMY